jgi:hypothetical protein
VRDFERSHAGGIRDIMRFKWILILVLLAVVGGGR